MKYEFKEMFLYVENFSVVYDDIIIIKDISFVEKDVVRDGIYCIG